MVIPTTKCKVSVMNLHPTMKPTILDLTMAPQILCHLSLILLLWPRRWALSSPQPLLGWNNRGICNAATVRARKAYLKGNSPDVVFLSETKASFSRMQFILKSIKFADMCVVEAKGLADGICMMWRSGITIQKVEFNKNLIAVKVADAMRSWLLVGFYDPPYPTKKQKAWENLMALLESYNCPWACLGDFNFTLEDNEISTKGSRGARDSKNNFLKELVFEYGAIDLGYSGNAYT